MVGPSRLASRPAPEAPLALRRRPLPGSPAPAMSATPAFLTRYDTPPAAAESSGPMPDTVDGAALAAAGPAPICLVPPASTPADMLTPTAEPLVLAGAVGPPSDDHATAFDQDPTPQSELPRSLEAEAGPPDAAPGDTATQDHGEVAPGATEAGDAPEGGTAEAPATAESGAAVAIESAAPASEGGAIVTAGTGSSGGSQRIPRRGHEDGEDNDPFAPLSDPEHGTPSLTGSTVFVDVDIPVFDAPRTLTIDVKKAKEPLEAEWARYRELYAEAAAGSYALYSQIVAGLHTLQAEIPAEADRAANQRQRNLDEGMRALDGGLASNRLRLRGSFRDDLARLDAAALTARLRINRTAANGAGRLRARAARVEADLAGKRAEAQTTAAMPEAKVLKLTTQQTATMAALNALVTNAETALTRPEAGTHPMLADAQLEAMVRDIRFPVNEARLTMNEAVGGMTTAIRAQIEPTSRSICLAFCPFETMKTTLTTDGVAAVGRARAQSLEQLAKQHRRLRRQLAKAQHEGERSLIRQHAGQRQRLLGAAADRQRMEPEQQRQQGKTAAAMMAAAAGAQNVALGSIYDRIVQRADRGEAPLARAASEFARGLITNGVPRGRAQLRGIERKVGTATTNLRRVGRMAGQRFDDGAAGAVEAIADEATRIDEAAAETVRQGEGLMLALPKPIAKTVDSFVTSTDTNFTAAMTRLTTQLDQIRQGLLDNFSGHVSTPGEEGAPAGNAPPCTICAPGAAPPAVTGEGPGTRPEAVDTFIIRIKEYVRQPETEPNVHDFCDRVPRLVENNITTRSRALQDILCYTDSGYYKVLDQLRGLTRRKGLALEEHFNATRRNLRADLDWFLNAGNPATGVTTRLESIRAARDYLNGDVVSGARHELNVCVEWSNDSGQIDKVMASLSDDERHQMFDRFPAELAAVRGDLSALDKRVFDAYTANDFGTARALRGRAAIDTGREGRGYAGTDRAGDAITTMYNEAQAGSRMTGIPELEGVEGDRTRRERIARDWDRIETSFAQVVGPEFSTLPGGAAGPPQQGDAIVNYAARGISYEIDVPNDVGEGSHRETVFDPVNDAQRRLFTALVRNHAGSPEARAARAALELSRPGGADPARVHEATYNEGLNFNLVVDDAIGGRAAAERRHAQALEDEARMYSLLDEYTGNDGTCRTTDASRRSLADQLAATLSRDPDRAAYVRSLVMADPSNVAREPEFINQTMHQLEFAVNGSGTDVPAMRRALASLTGEQYQMLKRRWRDEHHEDLDVRIGMPGSGTWVERTFVSETSGETAQEMQRLRLGIVRTPREQARLAALTMYQQVDENRQSLLGPTVAGDEFARLSSDYRNLLGLMGTADLRINGDGDLEFLDADGDPAELGHFTATGAFVPHDNQTAEDLAFAITLGNQSVEAYIAATDRIANMIATALVVAAAIISTALTGGAAASIWIPVLVTAGAGLLSMGVKYAIKGDRYGSEEMLFDLASTIIQAATAGIGAALGAALRGGSGAVGALAKSLRLSEQALATAANGGIAATKTLPALTLGQEILIGALTSGFAGGANAAIAPDSWRSKNYAGDIVAGVLRGALGGVIGAGVTRGMGRLTAPLGEVASRGIASGTSGAVSRLAELSFDEIVLGRHITMSEMMDEASTAFLQNLVQGMGEGMADVAIRSRSRSRQQEHQWAEDHNYERVTAREQQDVMQRLRQAAVEELARRNVPANDNAPPAAHVPEFASGGPVKPGSVADPLASPVLRVANDDAPGQTLGRARDDDADAGGMHPRSGDDAGEFRSNRHPADGPSWKEVMSLPARSLEEHAAEGNRLVQRHRVEATADLTAARLNDVSSLPEGSIIRATDPHSFDAALANYRALLAFDPTRELLLAYHPGSRVYAVIQGNTGRVGKPTTEGWIGQRHVHPRGFLQSIRAHILHNLPSGLEGDFGQLFNEVRFLRDLRKDGNVVAQESQIDVVQPDGSIQVTTFSAAWHPPPGGMEFAVRFFNPQSGAHETIGPHSDFSHYRDRVLDLTGRDIFKPPSAADADAFQTPSGGPAGRRDTAHTPESRRAAAMATEAEMRARIAAEPIAALTSALATPTDRDLAVRRLGLTGEPDSLARLTALINEPGLTPQARSVIAEATLSATRADLIRSGGLAPGDDVLLLFRGVTGERRGDYEAGGIEMVRLGPGRDEDAGRGLYGSQDLQSAMRYTGGDADGRVLPLIVRRSELGNVIDVRSGTPLGDRWLAYVRATAGEGRLMPGYPHLSGVLHPGIDLPIGLGRGGRGARFEEFLRTVAADPTLPEAMRRAAADPHITLMDLGGVASWGNDRGMMTDQFAMHHQRVADLFNDAHGFPVPGQGDDGTFRSMTSDAANDNDAASAGPAKNNPLTENLRQMIGGMLGTIVNSGADSDGHLAALLLSGSRTVSEFFIAAAHAASNGRALVIGDEALMQFTLEMRARGMPAAAVEALRARFRIIADPEHAVFQRIIEAGARSDFHLGLQPLLTQAFRRRLLLEAARRFARTPSTDERMLVGDRLSEDPEAVLRLIGATGDPHDRAARYADARAARGERWQDAQSDGYALIAAIAGDDFSSFITRARDHMAPLERAARGSSVLASLVRRQPEALLALAHGSSRQLTEYFVEMLYRRAERGRFGLGNADDLAQDFVAYVANRMRSNELPIASELSMVFGLREVGMTLLKSDPAQGGNANRGGLDIVAFGRLNGNDPANGGAVRILITDDKAVNRGDALGINELESVSAMTGPRYGENLYNVAQEIRAQTRALEALPGTARLPGYAEYVAGAYAAARQLARAGRAIARLPLPPDASTHAAHVRSDVYTSAVATILARYHIAQTISSRHGDINELPHWMRNQGMRLEDEYLRWLNAMIAFSKRGTP